MTDTEILELLGKILRGEGAEGDIGEWIMTLERAIRCPHLLDILRESNEFDTPETVLRKAREYKPFLL